MVQNRVVMQLQHHVHNTARQLWPRCTKVELRDNSLFCILNLDRQYDLIDSYQKDPHVQFLNCKSVDDLVVFMRAWGPLYLVESPSERKCGTAVRRVDECLAQLRWLRAVHQMIQACKGRADWRSSLLEYWTAESEIHRTSNIYRPGDIISPEQSVLQQGLQITGNMVDWIASTDIGSVQRAVARCVEVNVKAPMGWLKVAKRGRAFELTPSFELRTLWDALKWMLWFDEWNRWPPHVCPECRQVFRPATAHVTKYCSHGCAHRVTNRAWRRKDLRRKKRRR
jgi:hypothetical protein